MSALSAFTGLTQEGRSRSRRGCWGGGGWSANHPEPRQAAHSQIRPPPPAHALPFKAAGLHHCRTAQRTLCGTQLHPTDSGQKSVPRLQPPSLRSLAGSGYSLQEKVSPGTAASFSAGDHGTAAGCSLALGTLGPHLRQHLVPAICRRTGRAFGVSASLPSSGTFLVCATGWRALELGCALSSRGLS